MLSAVNPIVTKSVDKRRPEYDRISTGLSNKLRVTITTTWLKCVL